MQNLDKKVSTIALAGTGEISSAEALLTKMVESKSMQNILTALKQEGTIRRPRDMKVLSSSVKTH